MAAVVEAATKTAAAMATTCCRDWNRARRNLKLPTFPSPLTDGRARRSERRDSFSREEEDSRDPPQTGPRRGNTAVGRSSSSWIRRPARRPSLHRRPAATVPLSERASRFGGRTDGRTDGRQKIITRFSAPRRIIGLREAALSTHPSAPGNAFHLRGIICYVIYRQ